MTLYTQIPPIKNNPQFYELLFQHYKTIINHKNGCDLYFYSIDLNSFPVDLRVFPRISEKRNPKKYVITYAYTYQRGEIHPHENLITPFRLGRNIIGNNLMFPGFKPETSFDVYAGFHFATLAGGGSCDTWECRNGIWGNAESRRTWIS
jgi:hypothetical protein